MLQGNPATSGRVDALRRSPPPPPATILSTAWVAATMPNDAVTIITAPKPLAQSSFAPSNLSADLPLKVSSIT
ncbi:hypothetical protein D3C75_1216300 [compost metagenome]